MKNLETIQQFKLHKITPTKMAKPKQIIQVKKRKIDLQFSKGILPRG